LAVVGLFWALRKKSGIGWTWGALTVFSLGVILGVPPFLPLIFKMWGSKLILHGRISILIPFAIAALSGYAIEHMEELSTRKLLVRLWVPVAACGFVLGIVWHSIGGGTYPLIVFAGILGLLAFCLSGPIEIRAKAPGILAVVLTAAVCLELGLSADRLLNAPLPYPPMTMHDNYPVALEYARLRDPRLEAALEARDLRGKPGFPVRAATELNKFLRSFIPIYYEVASACAYLNAFPEDLLRFIRYPEPASDDAMIRELDLSSFSDFSRKVLRIGRILRESGPIDSAGNPIFPVAYYAAEVQPVASAEEALGLFYARSKDFKQGEEARLPAFVTVEKGKPQVVPRPFAQPEGTLRIVDARSNSIKFATASLEEQFLVIDEQYYRNWKVEIDGKPAEIFRTNFIMAGTYVPPGSHEVVFRYAFPLLGFCLFLTLAGGTMFAGLLFLPIAGEIRPF
jgi:hypothetical protein